MKIIRTSTIPLSLKVLLKGQLAYLSNFFEVICISSGGSDLEELSREESVKTIAINMERGISPFRDIISLVKLFFQLKKQKPQIIHSITPKAGLLSMLAGKLAGIPIRMHTFTGLIFPSKVGLMQKILIKMDQLLCWAATNVYPEGKGVRNDLIDYKITNKPLILLANGNVNGIDVSFFNPKLYSKEEKIKLKFKFNIQEEDFVFIFIGRMVKDKGVNELVNAFGKLKGQRCMKEENSDIKTYNCKLLLVGPYEQDLDPIFMETIREIECNPNIISVGFQNDVRPYLAIADALVFPSYREGFPNVVMQAGAMGLPSIVTDINGSNEIIIEGENGIIIPPKNEEALRNAMQLFLENPDEVKRMAGNSRALIVDRYEQRKVWEALLYEYERLGSEYLNK